MPNLLFSSVNVGALLGGRYRLVRWVAAGGMGSVWLANDTVLDRPVAVKTLSLALASDPRAVERLRREARAAAVLTHPNVARVYDFRNGGSPPGRSPAATPDAPFIVMEFVRGETLAAVIARRGRLDVQVAVAIATQVADALDAAHRSGIVHRDVKPGNVMIGDDGVVKVMDFGIAAVAQEARLTTTGTQVGTAEYLAPERAAGGQATAASDVYSLGVVLYEMLSGTPPFVAETGAAVALAHLRNRPRPLRDVVPGVPDRVAAACELALAKDPAERPSSAHGLAVLLTGEGPTLEVQAARASRGEGGGARTEPLQRSGSTAELAPPPTEPLRPTVVPGPTRLPTSVPPRTGSRASGRHGRRWVLVFAFLVLPALLLLGWALSSNDGRATEIRVPSLVGLSVDQASAALTQSHLSLGEVIPVNGPPGFVVSTSPPSGQTVEANSAVDLFVGSTSAPSPSPSAKHGNKGRHKGTGGD